VADPNDFDAASGLTREGLVHSYTSGIAGDVNKDYDAVMSGGLEAYRKAEFIFNFFASGSEWIDFKAMIALHRATEDSGMSDDALREGFATMLDERCEPDEWHRALGMRKGAFIRSYTEGWAGSVDADYEAINAGRLDFFVKADRQVLHDDKPDPKVEKEAINACHSEAKRAQHGYQMIMSFGARGNDDGSPLHVDGIKVGSGIDVVSYLHNFFCHWYFGSLQEGTRHIYFECAPLSSHSGPSHQPNADPLVWSCVQLLQPEGPPGHQGGAKA